MELLDIQNPENKHTRRWFFHLSFLGTLGVAAAGWWGWRRGVVVTEKDPALAPWDEWQKATDPQLRLVGAAVLAPSKHNSQPWQFRVQPGYIDVFTDMERNTGSLDPMYQEMKFGAGCALTNMVLAAQAEGLTPELLYMPDKEMDYWVAKLNLTPGASKVTSPLYEAIPKRHTNRGAYVKDKPVPIPVLDELARAAAADGVVQTVWLTGKDQQAAFAKLTIDSTNAILADEDQVTDGATWNRPTWGDARERHDGMTLDAAALPAGRKLIDKLFASPSSKDLNDWWLERTKKIDLATAPAFGILTVANGKDPVSWIQAGMAWQRMHLLATSKGLAVQPLTQSIERSARETATASQPVIGNPLRALAAGTGDPVFAFRIGYPTTPAVESPRRGVEEVVFKKEKKRKSAEG